MVSDHVAGSPGMVGFCSAEEACNNTRTVVMYVAAVDDPTLPLYGAKDDRIEILVKVVFKI